MAHDQGVVGSNPGTAYWMDVSDLLAITIKKIEKKYYLISIVQLKLTWATTLSSQSPPQSWLSSPNIPSEPRNQVKKSAVDVFIIFSSPPEKNLRGCDFWSTLV